MNFSDLRANLVLNISNFTNALNRARSQSQRFMSDFARMSADFANNRMVEGYTTLSERLHNVGLGLKDIARISSGIMVSQLFYGISRSIREATSALWDFNESLDYANITYSSLFGSSNLAGDFLEVLKQFSVDTIFEYSDIEGMARKLSAYGIEYKNLMYIIEGLTNIGTISGDTAALERLAVAIGQINAKGTLKAEEMRQLANAYTPIYDVLREKLHLTEEDLGRVGDLGIKSADAINAIIDYANETFGATADAAVLTITGLKNKIVDTLKVTGVEMIAPISTAYKSLLVYVSEGLASLRDAFATGGWGGLFEQIVPNEKTQQVIRQFVANVKNLFMSVAAVLKVVGDVARNVFSVFVTAFNIIVPVMTPVINTLSYFLHLAMSTKEGMLVLRTAILVAASAFVVLRMQALYALVINAVSKAVAGLSKALIVLSGIITRHPIIALLSALGIGLIAVASNSDKAKKSIGGFMDKLTGSTGGTTSGDVLKRVEGKIRDNTVAAEQFNQRLEEGKGAAEALEDSIKGTGKAAKKTAGLLAFDEVFKLTEDSSSSSGSGSGGALGAIDDLVGAVNGLGSSLIPTIPDFTEYAKNFSDSLFGSIKDVIPDSAKSVLGNMSLGALIGGIIGGLVTKSMSGVKIGALIGGGAGGFWAWLEEQLGLEIGAGGAGTGAGFGIAAMIAKAFGGSIDELGVLLKADSFSGFFANLAGLFKGTGAKSLLKGGLLGAAIGFVVDLIAASLFDGLADKLELGADSKQAAKIGSSIAGIIGTVIGMALGGGGGAIVGGAIGTFAGGFVGLLWDHIKEAFSTVPTGVITAISGALAGLPGLLISSYFTSENSEKIGTWWDGIQTKITTWCTDAKTALSTWWTNTSSLFKTWWGDSTGGFKDWWTDTKGSVKNWWSDTVATFSDWDSITGSTLGNWWRDTTQGFKDWWTDTKGSIENWWTDTTSGFKTWATDSLKPITEWASNTFNKIKSWASDTKEKIDAWVLGTILRLVSWSIDTEAKIKTWASNTIESIKDWIADTWAKLSNWATEAGKFVTGFTIAAAKAVVDWAAKTLKDITIWASDMLGKFGKFFTDLGKSISDWFAEKTLAIKILWALLFDPTKWKAGWDNVKSWFSTLFTAIGSWFTGLVTSVKNWWVSLWDTEKWSSGWGKVKGWFSSVSTSISSWFTDLITSIKTWWGNLWNTKNWTSGWDKVKVWFSDLLGGIRNWFSSIGSSVSTWWENLWDGKKVNVNVNEGGTGSTVTLGGHAKGGIFNREHIARFAEGNKAEAVIPLEDQSAMQPFVNAIADGILQGLMPTMATAGGNSNSLPPMYVGTLVADERGLQQLFKKFEVYEAKELARKGLA